MKCQATFIRVFFIITWSVRQASRLARERILAPTGHSHDYERSAPQQGVTDLIVGTGGGDLEEETKAITSINRARRRLGLGFGCHFSVTKLQIDSNGVHGSFASGPSSIVNGKNIDEISCAPGTTLNSFPLSAKP